MPIRSVTIPAGGSTYVPKGSKVILITSTGEAGASSECLDLTEIGLKCWKFYIAQEDEKMFDQLKMGTNIYPFSQAWPDDMPYEISVEMINLLPEGLKDVLFCTNGPSTSNVIVMRAPANLPAPELGFSDNDGDFGQDANRGYLIADEAEDCDTCP